MKRSASVCLAALLPALLTAQMPAPGPAAPPAAPVVAPAPPPPPPSAARPVVAVPADDPIPAAEPAAPARERTVYIPYEKLWKVFEQQQRGVFLPQAEFERLWKAAQSNVDAIARAEPPVPALIKEAAGQVRVGAEVAEATATLRIELLKPGWHEVALGLGDVGVLKATAGGQPARLRHDATGGYRLLVERPVGQPAGVEVQVQFARTYEKTPGLNRLGFTPPLCAVSRWEFIIPEAGVQARVQPNLATAQAAAPTGAETRVSAVVGAAGLVTLEWTPRAEGAVGLEALAAVQGRQEIVVDEGVTRIRAVLAYTISRAKLQRLELEVPADVKVVGVQDQNVREWRVAPAGGFQRVQVDLFEPASATQNLTVELEKLGDDPQPAFTPVRALGVSRQQGSLAVRTGARLRAEVTARDGLIQVAPAEWPAEWRGQAWPFAFQYIRPDARLQLRVEAIQPRVSVFTGIRLNLKPDLLQQDARLLYRIEKAGLYRLAVRLPADFEVVKVEGFAAAGLTAAAVENHFVEQQRLTVNLSAQALGDVGLRVLLQRRLAEPALLEPPGRSAALAVALVAADPAGLEAQRGFLELQADGALKTYVADLRGLQAGPPPAEPEWGRLLDGRLPPSGHLWSGAAGGLTIQAERKAPYVSVGQLLLAEVEAGRVSYTATLRADIRYSGVRQILLDVPAALAGSLRLAPEAISYRLRPAAGAELTAPAPATNQVRLAVEGLGELIGNHVVPLRWTAALPDLPPGSSTDLDLPQVQPARVDHAWGQIVLKKAEAIELVPADAPAGLRPIDAERDLMAGQKVPGAAQAYEFRGPWSLRVRATRFDLAEVKATSIERGLVRQVATRGGLASVQALYQLRSARQRLALRLPAGVEFDAQPARLNGSPVTLERGGAGEFFVPLLGRNPDELFLLELRYTVPAAGLQVVVPAFPEEPALQKVYLSLYLPDELRFLGARGPWTEDNIWVLSEFDLTKRGRRTADDLLDWVSGGLPVDRAALGNFAVDGRHLLFYALRPAAGDAGALAVRAVSYLGWQIAVVVVVVLAGLLLFRAPLARVLRVGAVAIVLWTVAMMFWPDVACAFLSNATAGALVVAGTPWAVRQLLGLRLRSSASPPPTPPAPAAGEGGHEG